MTTQVKGVLVSLGFVLVLETVVTVCTCILFLVLMRPGRLLE